MTNQVEPSWPIVLSKRDRRFEIALVVGFLGLFMYAVIEWLQMRGNGNGSIRLAILSGALVLQPVAVLVRSRSRATFYVLVFLSIAGIVAALFIS